MDAPRIDRLIPSIPIEPIPGKETRPINAGLSTLQDGCAQRVDTSSRNQFATPFFHQPKSTRLCVATSCAEQRWVVPQGQRIVWTRFVKQAGIFVWSQGFALRQAVLKAMGCSSRATDSLDKVRETGRDIRLVSRRSPASQSCQDGTQTIHHSTIQVSGGINLATRPQHRGEILLCKSQTEYFLYIQPVSGTIFPCREL